MKKYHIVINESQQGPFTIEELLQKKIISTTLVWTEQLDNWTEAKNIKELESIFKKNPPPIPQKTEEPLQVGIVISKKKEKLITPQTEVKVAQETKVNFKLILISILIGVLSFPIFFAIKKGFTHQYLAYKLEKHIKGSIDNEELRLLKIESSALGKCCLYLDDEYSREDISDYISYHKEKSKYYAEDSLECSLNTALISAIILILGRYITNGAKWVKETSKKEI